MSRAGRPAGADSAETRQRILDSARMEFAVHGYGAAAITAIAESAGLAPGSIYHHYTSKASLYEAVFDDASSSVWTELRARASAYQSVVEAIDAMVDTTRQLSETRRYYHDFLANVPMESRLHPEFAHLLAYRSKYQDETFGIIAELGIATGELAGFDLKQATELIRAPIMGWFFESYLRGAEVKEGAQAIKALFRILADRPSQPPHADANRGSNV